MPKTWKVARRPSVNGARLAHEVPGDARFFCLRVDKALSRDGWSFTIGPLWGQMINREKVGDRKLGKGDRIRLLEWKGHVACGDRNEGWITDDHRLIAIMEVGEKPWAFVLSGRAEAVQAGRAEFLKIVNRVK